ncbi:hypothetical protein AVT69_gp027 [Pseudomonas phage PhiPA3]|uniref:Uncharacterized protein 026 n=1 Tax=Pseudomonas phage PhiPA3 TaxID=998086 RepID=F8SJQ8_BPPA3|nr:hypothetical protein AVT69_gp027 [Pseudomonas phage PhiPA3]AEH03453.1 hypothetical protein [Pseudomonas phage PhiPA3]
MSKLLPYLLPLNKTRNYIDKNYQYWIDGSNFAWLEMVTETQKASEAIETKGLGKELTERCALKISIDLARLVTDYRFMQQAQTFHNLIDNLRHAQNVYLYNYQLTQRHGTDVIRITALIVTPGLPQAEECHFTFTATHRTFNDVAQPSDGWYRIEHDAQAMPSRVSWLVGVRLTADLYLRYNNVCQLNTVQPLALSAYHLDNISSQSFRHYVDSSEIELDGFYEGNRVNATYWVYHQL